MFKELFTEAQLSFSNIVELAEKLGFKRKPTMGFQILLATKDFSLTLVSAGNNKCESAKLYYYPDNKEKYFKKFDAKFPKELKKTMNDFSI